MYDEMKQQQLFEKFDGIKVDDAPASKEQKLNIAGEDVKRCETVCQIQATSGDGNHEV